MCHYIQEMRFQEPKTTSYVAPGPGTYESEDPNASMVKRSFNVTVDGVMW